MESCINIKSRFYTCANRVYIVKIFKVLEYCSIESPTKLAQFSKALSMHRRKIGTFMQQRQTDRIHTLYWNECNEN